MAKKFGITMTMIYNGYVEIEAETEDEALDLAEELLNKEGGDVDKAPYKIGEHFSFGEATCDAADEI